MTKMTLYAFFRALVKSSFSKSYNHTFRYSRTRLQGEKKPSSKYVLSLHCTANDGSLVLSLYILVHFSWQGRKEHIWCKNMMTEKFNLKNASLYAVYVISLFSFCFMTDAPVPNYLGSLVFYIPQTAFCIVWVSPYTANLTADLCCALKSSCHCCSGRTKLNMFSQSMKAEILGLLVVHSGPLSQIKVVGVNVTLYQSHLSQVWN